MLPVFTVGLQRTLHFTYLCADLRDTCDLLWASARHLRSPVRRWPQVARRFLYARVWGGREEQFQRLQRFSVGYFLTILFSQSFSNLPFLPLAESLSQDAPDLLLVQEPPCRLLHVNAIVLSPTPNGTCSAANTLEHTHALWFFRASSGTRSPGASSSRPGSSGWDSISHNKQRRSTNRSRVRDRDVGDTLIL